MGAGISHLLPCVNPEVNREAAEEAAEFSGGEPLDETLGHSFCYVRSSARFAASPPHSDRFVSPSQSLRFDEPVQQEKPRPGGVPETGFRAISGASVSANTSTPRTVLQVENFYEDGGGTDGSTLGFSGGTGSRGSFVNGFESTSSFTALPLQPIPRGGSGREPPSGPMERAFFMSGPIERGALSGPLDFQTGLDSTSNGVPFSAPLGGVSLKKKRRRGISGIRKALYLSFPEKKRQWVLPVRHFAGRKTAPPPPSSGRLPEMSRDSNVQWALGKAGEDRVHVVVSEEHGWLFVGIYDGFNGPDAPEFLMTNLYKAMHKKLEGLFWDNEEIAPEAPAICENIQQIDKGSAKKVTFHSEEEVVVRRRRRLWEYLAEDHPEDGLDLSGSDRFAFSVEDAIRVNNAGSSVRRSLLLSKLKHGLSMKHMDGKKLFPWRFGGLKGKEKVEEGEDSCRVGEGRSVGNGRRRKVGPVDHELVLRAMSGALEMTENAYLDMTDKLLDQYPELALMGSCLLVVLMRDEDVYVMNVGDSRAIVAKYEPTLEEATCSSNSSVIADRDTMRLTALQLSTDHSTSIEEEVRRIKKEHPDDSNCIVNDRVKGRLKVTRAFGAGSLKQRKLNDALLEMFRNDYIGNAPYVSCTPSLRHHRICAGDQFLVLSSDGLYQYLTNEEVVSHVGTFLDKFPEGDPAQHLIEELLFRAAKKAGMELHELLDIPTGDRRKYHDDVTVMVISLEGRIWKSSGKYL
ncbi:unnamed protein product [Cuscuta campestris]|uniref:protein-serine/threonine phosphatase n=1 Tax=Cuscuta campestris TaxID=132261 RepID=A0A484KM52_9ASTE|nr:unnamed protein product [Cuscuta campestris]